MRFLLTSPVDVTGKLLTNLTCCGTASWRIWPRQKAPDLFCHGLRNRV